MFVPFETLPAEARLWIYQSDREFSPEEETIIDQELKLFTDRWSAHGRALKTSYKIAYHQFVLLAADESHYPTSGCSVDDSVHFLQAIGTKTTIDFFNRNLIAFLINDNVSLVPLAELKPALNAGRWNHDTLMFNNVVTTKGEADAKWVIPASDSWLNRYLNHLTIAR